MKKVSFSVHKWGVRLMIAVGALLGISACCHTKKVVEDDNYNNNNNNMPPIHNLKYGPLVDTHYDRRAVLIQENVGEDGNVVADSSVVKQEAPKIVEQIFLEDE